MRSLNNRREKSNFVVRKSKVRGAGLGLFAKKSLSKGVTLLVTGMLIKRGSDVDRFTHYADHHKFRVGRVLLIPMGMAGMVNHSLNPNMEKIIRGKKVYLKTLKPIAKGEELFFTYNKRALTRLGLRGIHA